MNMSMNTSMSVRASAEMQSTNSTGAWQQQKQNLNQLKEALSSGNLGAAKEAFNALSANAPKGITADPNSAISKIGKALQAGDVQGALDTLTAMQSGKHHHASSAQTSTAVRPAQPTSSASMGTMINTMA